MLITTHYRIPNLCFRILLLHHYTTGLIHQFLAKFNNKMTFVTVNEELPETINKNKLLANQCKYEKFSIWRVHFNSINKL